MKHYAEYYFDGVGRLTIGEEDSSLTDLHFEKSSARARGEFAIKETALLAEARRELEEYFRGERRTFDLPLAPRGTPFQLRCWSALLRIPYGETAAYRDIALAVGSPKAFRAVGMANNRNPIAIIIPCHRVVGADRSLVGFGGGLEVKEFLLGLEAKYRWGRP